MERSLDALLDRGWLDRGWLDRGWQDRGWQDRGWQDRRWQDRRWQDRRWQDRGPLDHASLDREALDREALPDGDPARWQPVAQVLAALTSAPESSELTGEARALAEFRARAKFQASGADLPSQVPRRDPGWMTWLPGGRPAVAAATGALLMGGLLAVAYAGDLPGAAQRLAHKTIDAPAVSPDPGPAASSRPTWPPSSAGPAGHRATHASAGPDHRVRGGSASGRPHRYRSSSSPPGSWSGSPRPDRQGQSGSPGRSSEPGPTQDPSPSASISPPSGATPSPSAAPSPTRSRHHHPQQSPSSPQSTPP